MASALSARVTLLHVLPVPASVDRLTAVDPLEWRVRRAEAETYLQGMQSRLAAAGVVADTQVADGQGAEQIITYAREHRIGLTMMSSHGQSGLSGWNVSSVVQKVILRLYSSIMVVRAYQPPPPEPIGLHYRRLLVPLDGSQRAENALPLVADLARAHESRVLLAHVVQRPEMPRRTPLTMEDTDLIEHYMERNRTEGLRYLEEIRGRLSGVEAETRLVVGNQVETALHSLAEQEEMDLVLLSAHGYTGEVIWPYGSVAVSFIAYGSAPVLIVQDVRPEDTRPTHAELAMQHMGRR
jgi:nucleotide-binding universal stress UspA family protein